MKFTTVREIYKNREEYMNQEVTVGEAGFAASVVPKAFGFIVLHDGSYFETLQIVYHDTMANFAEISKLNVGAAIIVKGNSGSDTGGKSSRLRFRQRKYR